MPRYRIYPYKRGSRSAKALADALGGKVLKLEGSSYQPRSSDVVVNWGSSSCPAFGPASVLNALPQLALCKRKTFIALEDGEVRTPRYTTSRADAEGWDFPVVCRTVLNGHSGAGIVIANSADELVEAPLYTQYVKKKDEYRVHVCKTPDDDPDAWQVWPFFIQRKTRKIGHENPNWQVRNLAGGFAFVEVQYDDVPFDVITQANNAILALGLDFGGVDVLWNAHEQKAYALEVNTACGLEERTALKYAEALKGLFS